MELTLDTIRDLKIYQAKRGYRFSVDALLVYSFVNLKYVKKIADMGAGSGIIGLLLARRYQDSEVTLIELQEKLVRLAERNIALNNLAERVKVIDCDMKKIKTVHCSRPGKSPEETLFTAHSFDLVVSNPPFRRQRSGLVSPEDEKAIARHEIKLELTDLIDTTYHLLRSKGRLCMIYHPSRLAELIAILRKRQMEPKRLRFVHSDSQTEAKMLLIEAVKDGRAEIKIEKPLFIYEKDRTYTSEIKALY